MWYAVRTDAFNRQNYENYLKRKPFIPKSLVPLFVDKPPILDCLYFYDKNKVGMATNGIYNKGIFINDSIDLYEFFTGEHITLHNESWPKLPNYVYFENEIDCKLWQTQKDPIQYLSFDKYPMVKFYVHSCNYVRKGCDDIGEGYKTKDLYFLVQFTPENFKRRVEPFCKNKDRIIKYIYWRLNELDRQGKEKAEYSRALQEDYKKQKEKEQASAVNWLENSIRNK